jgi:O-antigen/teichoic acid export membrane protein
MSVSGSIINASGKPRWTVFFMAVTLLTSGITAFLLVPNATPGAPMLLAQATAVATGNGVGLALALLYLWRQFKAGPPVLSVLRIGAAVAIAVVAGRVFPAGGKLMGLVTLAVVGAVFVACLVILRELGPNDTAKLRKILRRGK